jgi:hypothetical protein
MCHMVSQASGLRHQVCKETCAILKVCNWFSIVMCLDFKEILIGLHSLRLLCVEGRTAAQARSYSVLLAAVPAS